MLQIFDERNRDLKVNINGKLLHRDEAGISPFDSLVQGGDGVWEGLRLYQGKIFKLNEHLVRLRNSAKALAFTDIPSVEKLIDEIRKTLHANDMNDCVHIRLTLSRGLKITSGMDPRLNQFGPTVIVLPEWKKPVYDRKGLQFITSSIRRFPPDCLDPKIHHNNLIQSIMAKVEANVAGADAAVMLDKEGFIAEADGTHLFLVHDGVVYTSHTDACPEGITRDTVIELCNREGIPLKVGRLSTTDAYRADEMFCSGTMGELASVIRLDGRTIGAGQPGPLTGKLSKLYTDETARSGFSIV